MPIINNTILYSCSCSEDFKQGPNIRYLAASGKFSLLFSSLFTPCPSLSFFDVQTCSLEKHIVLVVALETWIRSALFFMAPKSRDRGHTTHTHPRSNSSSKMGTNNHQFTQKDLMAQAVKHNNDKKKAAHVYEVRFIVLPLFLKFRLIADIYHFPPVFYQRHTQRSHGSTAAKESHQRNNHQHLRRKNTSTPIHLTNTIIFIHSAVVERVTMPTMPTNQGSLMTTTTIGIQRAVQ